ncbi:PRSS8 protein, partial [Rhinopomastus cyanomelas]|nr:PRSS8 protein [Rhinopomastus cyanomelas]
PAWVASGDPDPAGGAEVAGDLALARLDPPVTPSRLVRPICLPESSLRLPPGTNCTLTGWGDLHTARRHWGGLVGAWEHKGDLGGLRGLGDTGR